MRAPAFWWKEAPDLHARLLSPLGALYGAITARRMARVGESCGVPVICIGNFVAGGAGKTPTAIAVAEVLAAAGRRPAFLSRGYGGRVTGPPHRVEPAQDTADVVGDEPLLLATCAPTFIAADRIAGARACVAAGADLVVMDDGLQNRRLARNLNIAVVDGAVGIGNGLCLPAGPLRAPLADQWPHVEALLVIGGGAPGEALVRNAQQLGKTVLQGDLVPDPDAVARLAGQRVVAFAGIGRPDKFFDTLRALGADLVEGHPFADHHAFSRHDLASLRAAAARRGAQLVTTQKDAVRLGPGNPDIAALPVRLELRTPAVLAGLLDRLRA